MSLAPVEVVFLRQWGSEGSGEGEFVHPAGMCVSGEEVFVCDQFNHRIQVFARDGSFARQWDSLGSGQGQFVYPRNVAVSEGEVFVCDQTTVSKCLAWMAPSSGRALKAADKASLIILAAWQ